MSGSYFDPDWAAKVTVPVKRVGERWEFFYGGAFRSRTARWVNSLSMPTRSPMTASGSA